MRLTLTSIVCFTLFVFTKAAPPSHKRCCEPGPSCSNPCPSNQGGAGGAALSPGPDPFTFMSPVEQGAPNSVMSDCCAPGPSCFNPCQQGPPPQTFAVSFPAPPAAPMLPPPPPPIYTGDNCCPPGPTCSNPCDGGPPMAPPMAPMAPQMAPPMAPQMAPPMAPPMGPPMAPMGMDPCCDPGMVQGCANPCAPPAAPAQPQTYAPYPGEITFKLYQTWDADKYLDEQSAAFNILAGNLGNAIKTVLGPMTQISNIYFREGYVPGNPSTMPKVVAHVMVDGGSDAASLLQRAVTPDGTLGDGLKVYKDSFNAY